MFAETSGSADVSRNGTHVRTLEPGDVFGEVLYGGVRTATVVAKTDMKLVTVFNSELARLDREVPEITKTLRATVAERLGSDR